MKSYSLSLTETSPSAGKEKVVGEKLLRGGKKGKVESFSLHPDAQQKEGQRQGRAEGKERE